MKRKSRFIDCRNLTFSSSLGQNRMQWALQSLGETVVHRILSFSLYLLGVNRQAIGRALGIPAETAKSIIKTVSKDGLPALEDRRHRISTFLPRAPSRSVSVTLHTIAEHIVVDFAGRRLEIPRRNVLQLRTILLSMLNSGLLTQRQVADAIGLTPAHTASLARRLNSEGLGSLIDKRQGQQSDYRITPEVKAELVQQFAVDVIARGKTSGDTISAELQDRCQITVPARTVRHHLARMGLGQIKHSLPQLVATVKKTSATSS